MFIWLKSENIMISLEKSDAQNLLQLHSDILPILRAPILIRNSAQYEVSCHKKKAHVYCIS